METSEISFCNGKGYNIKNNREKSNILKGIYDKYSIIIDNNDNILTYNDRLLDNLKKYNYLVSTITQGNQYCLYLTKIGNENYCIFLDTKVNENYKFPKLILVNFRFHENLFSDTLLKGDLIKDYNNKWQFLISDVLIYKGKVINTYSLIDKIKLMYSIFKNYYIKDDFIDICDLKIKRYFNYNELDYLIENFIPNSNYKILGIYFHPSSTNIRTIKFVFNFNLTTNTNSFNYEFLKDNNSIQITKKNEDKLLDFIIENNYEYDINSKILDKSIINKDITFTFQTTKTKFPNIYNLYCLKNNKLRKYSIAKIDTLECSKFMKDLFSKDKKQYLIECYYYKDFNKWVPKCISKKKTINSYSEIKASILKT